MSSINLGEVFVHQRVRIIKTSVTIFKVTMPNAAHSIADDFRNPLIFKLKFPVVVISSYGYLQIFRFVGQIQINPCIYIFNCNTLPFSIGSCRIFSQELLDRLNWILCEDVL